MVLIKLGESFAVSSDSIRNSEDIKQDPELHEKVIKMAANFKKIAPKAEDFLYFTAIMMHAAERSLYDEDGNPLKNPDGTHASANWEINEKTGSWRWVANNATIKPYKNHNGDIFPEPELKKAYKHWVGKPLCKDHQSSSVDGVRGFIVDTYWDDKYKRIIALCALDKISYPDLARKVATGYLTSCSMGTAVSNAICFDCGNVAKTEAEYCPHMKNKTCYGEINVGLQPIELSLVVNGADRKAQILEVLASANQFEENLKKVGSVDINRIKEIKNEFQKLANKIDEIEKDILSNNDDNNLALKRVAHVSNQDNDLDLIKQKMSNIEETIQTIAKNLNMEDLMTNTKKAYMQGTEPPHTYPKEEADKIRLQDSHMKDLTNLGPVDGLPPQDMETKKMLARASIEERRALRAAAVEQAQNAIKRAYNSGCGKDCGEERPSGGYPVDPGYKVRDTEFKFNNNMGNDGLCCDDEKVKKQLSRASFKARLVRSAKAGDNRWEVVDTTNNQVVLSASFDEITGKKPALYSVVASDDFAREMMKTIRSAGINKANEIYKSAQAQPAAPAPAVPAAGDPGAAPAPVDLPPPEGDMPAMEAGGPVDEAALKEVADLAKQVSTKLDEMTGGVGALGEEAAAMPGAEAVTENPEAATEQALADLTAGPPANVTASLNTLRIVLNAGLNKAFKKNIKGLKAAKEELDLLISTANTNSVSPEFFANISKEAVADANKLLKKARMLQGAFVKYAKGTQALEKRAAMENRMRKLAQQKPAVSDTAKAKMVGLTPEKDPITGLPKEKGLYETTGDKPMTEAEKTNVSVPKAPAAPATPAKPPTTAAQRRDERQKLAAAVESKMKYSDMIGKAHPKSDAKLSGIADPSGEAVVEGIDTAHEDIMKTVSNEPKVKKAAEQLDKLIKAGKVNANDIDEMVKEGLDKDVANYWKKYYGQVDGGGEFATALVKEYSNAKSEKKAAEDLENYKAKYAKAYDLAYDMAECGMINRTNGAIKAEAEKIVNYSDDAYDSMKRVVAHHTSNMKKTASVQMGVALDSDDVTTKATGSLYDELVSAFSGRRY